MRFIDKLHSVEETRERKIDPRTGKKSAAFRKEDYVGYYRAKSFEEELDELARMPKFQEATDEQIQKLLVDFEKGKINLNEVFLKFCKKYANKKVNQSHEGDANNAGTAAALTPRSDDGGIIAVTSDYFSGSSSSGSPVSINRGSKRLANKDNGHHVVSGGDGEWIHGLSSYSHLLNKGNMYGRDLLEDHYTNFMMWCYMGQTDADGRCIDKLTTREIEFVQLANTLSHLDISLREGKNFKG